MDFPNMGCDSSNKPYQYLVKINGNPGFGGSNDENAAVRIFNSRVAQRSPSDNITLHCGGGEPLQKQMGSGKTSGKAPIAK